MECKGDWETVKKRYDAFWSGELVDRAVFHVVAPDKETGPVPEPPADPEKRFTDSDYLSASGWARIENTYWGADSLPLIAGGCGVYCPEGLMGSTPSYGNTIWMEPGYGSVAEMDLPLGIDWSTPAWQRQEAHFRRVCTESAGKCFVMLPPLWAGLDSVSSLIGSEQLCYELAEPTQKLDRLLKEIDAAWAVVFETFWRIAEETGAKLTSFLPLYTPGRFCALQCDFMVMISGEMFRRYQVPSLQFCGSYMDHCLFHLDGAEAVQGLDSLLGCDVIDGIQWQQGGSWERSLESVLPWLDMLKKIQDAGKKVYVNCTPDEIEPVMRHLSSRNLYLATGAASPEDADDMEKLVTKLTHD